MLLTMIAVVVFVFGFLGQDFAAKASALLLGDLMPCLPFGLSRAIRRIPRPLLAAFAFIATASALLYFMSCLPSIATASALLPPLLYLMSCLPFGLSRAIRRIPRPLLAACAFVFFVATVFLFTRTWLTVCMFMLYLMVTEDEVVPGDPASLFLRTPSRNPSSWPKDIVTIPEELMCGGACEDDVPSAMKCPITLSIMKNPTLVVTSGMTYENESIRTHKLNRPTAGDPLTRAPFRVPNDLVANYAMRDSIEDFAKKWKLAHPNRVGYAVV